MPPLVIPSIPSESSTRPSASGPPPRGKRRSDATRRASLELFPGRGYEDALDGLGAWDYAWVLFVFHKNVEEGRGWKPKVLPPRSDAKRGVFATRSPHRPNPIGLSAVKIERVEGLFVHVRDLDLLDGTPVLDLKPYVAVRRRLRRGARGVARGARPHRRRGTSRSPTRHASELAWLARTASTCRARSRRRWPSVRSRTRTGASGPTAPGCAWP